MLPIHTLTSCGSLLRVASAAAAAASQSLVSAISPTAQQQQNFSTSCGSQASLLPAPLNRWLRKQQRGNSIYPINGPLQPGTISAPGRVPPHIPRPHYAAAKPTTAGGSTAPRLSKQPEIMSDEASRAAMRAVGRLAAEALALAGSMAVEGVTTQAIDAAVHGFLVSRGAYPSPLGYHGFPKSVCTSPNEVVCHGVPDSRPLQGGDLLNVDVTAYLNGYHGDTNATFCVGQVSDAALELVDVTRQCLAAATDVCGPGVPFRAIGEAVSAVADRAGMYVNRDFVGHGIGRQFHAAPAVLHHRNRKGGRMQLWQCFTIEPILALGSWRQQSWALDPTGWTCVTPDGSLTAQFEHTLLITSTGAEVLTQL